MPDGLRLALTTLTVLPVRGPASVDRRTAGTAMGLAPLVGLLLGAAAAAVLILLAGTPLLAAVAAVALLAALTRGLHLDGLADLADGLGSYGPPERARQVMKQPDLGPLGMVTVLLSLLLQVAALHGCLDAGRGPLAVVLAVVTGRVAVALACTPATPAATPEGLGALVAGTVPPPVALAWAAVTAAVALLLDPWLALAVVVALGAARLLRRHAVRRVGGVTGDVLGALVETATTAVLVVAAVSP